MAEYGQGSSQDGDNQGLAVDEKPRLTEEEKKQNHIQSGAYLLAYSPTCPFWHDQLTCRTSRANLPS